MSKVDKARRMFRNLFELPRDKKIKIIIYRENEEKGFEEEVLEDTFIMLVDSNAASFAGKETLKNITIPYFNIVDIKRRGNSIVVRTNDKFIPKIVFKY